jgi:hypothetical protein
MKINDRIMIDLASHMNAKINDAILHFLERGGEMGADRPSMIAAISVVAFKHGALAMKALGKDEEDVAAVAVAVYESMDAETNLEIMRRKYDGE